MVFQLWCRVSDAHMPFGPWVATLRAGPATVERHNRSWEEDALPGYVERVWLPAGEVPAGAAVRRSAEGW